MKPEIIFEDNDFVVVNKPAGLSVHNPTPTEPSVLDFFEGYHLAHRLDRETSGVLILSKSKVSTLMEALNKEGSQKFYLALLRGKITPNTPLHWTQKLTDKAEGRKNPQGKSQERVACTTIVTPLKTNAFFTLASCEIKTGRQHQIRKHAALNKHPIVGDSRYNDPSYNKKISQLYNTERLFLHAQKLILNWKSQQLTFEAPLDTNFTKIINSLEEKQSL